MKNIKKALVVLSVLSAGSIQPKNAYVDVSRSCNAMETLKREFQEKQEKMQMETSFDNKELEDATQKAKLTSSEQDSLNADKLRLKIQAKAGERQLEAQTFQKKKVAELQEIQGTVCELMAKEDKTIDSVQLYDKEQSKGVLFVTKNGDVTERFNDLMDQEYEKLSEKKSGNKSLLASNAKAEITLLASAKKPITKANNATA